MSGQLKYVFGLVRLQALEELRVEPERAQLAPGQVVLLDVRSREREHRLPPEAEDLDTLHGADEHRRHAANAV